MNNADVAGKVAEVAGVAAGVAAGNPVAIAEAIAMAADVVELLARGAAAKQQLDAAIARATAAGLTDIPDSEVEAARAFCELAKADVIKDLGADPAVTG